MRYVINVIGPDNVVRESYDTDAYLLVVQTNGEVRISSAASSLAAIVTLVSSLVAKIKTR